MPEERTFTEAQAHRHFAVNCFNQTWRFIEKADRTPEDDHTMLSLAYTSLHHWMQIGAPVNFVRGHWLLSRVYAVLKDGAQAKAHGARCLDLCEQDGIGDFDLAYAYEALARASHLLGEVAERDNYIRLADEAGKYIAKEEDRKLFLSDMATIKG